MKACFSIYAKPNLSLNSFLQCEMIDFQTLLMCTMNHAVGDLSSMAALNQSVDLYHHL